MWINPDDIIELDFWPRIGRLLFLYLMNVQVFMNIDAIYNYEPLKNLQNVLVSKLNDDSKVGIINNVFNNWLI